MFSGLKVIENKELTANPSWASVADRLTCFQRGFVFLLFTKKKVKKLQNECKRNNRITKSIKKNLRAGNIDTRYNIR